MANMSKLRTDIINNNELINVLKSNMFNYEHGLNNVTIGQVYELLYKTK